jgi:hypothetical protein
MLFEGSYDSRIFYKGRLLMAFSRLQFIYRKPKVRVFIELFVLSHPQCLLGSNLKSKDHAKY